MPEQPSGRAECDPLAPWPTLAERDAGELPGAELYEGVPPHLSPHLSGWVSNTLVSDEFARKVLTRLRVSWDLKVTGDRVRGRQVVQWLADGHTSALQFARPVDRLSAVNAIIGLHPWWEDETRDQADGLTRRERWFTQLVALKGLLTDCGSAWDVNGPMRGLCRRVDPTVAAAFEAMSQASPASAAQYLRSAWRHAYGMSPDPTASYRETVRAVEAVACPLLLPLDPRPTLGKAVAHLRDSAAYWETELVGKDGQPGGPEPIIALLDRLWTGQVSRHGGDRARDQSQTEAEAAVHLGVLAVQWFTGGVLRRRGSVANPP